MLLALTLSAGRAGAQSRSSDRQARPTDPLAQLQRTISTAETSLQEGETHIAESRYRSALFEAWMIRGSLYLAARRLPDAREAFRHASRSAVDADAALQSLALTTLEMGETSDAVTILTQLAARNGTDVTSRRLLAQALMANRQPAEAVQTLEEAHASAPDDSELAFLLAAAYLDVRKLEPAERLFADVLKAHPGAETDVLIGRTYRDHGFYDRAREALERALKKDPRIRRAHYYLGTLAVLTEGVLRLDDAIREFEAELRINPRDPVTNLRLGMALVEAQRPEPALTHLLMAAASKSAPTDAFLYLGRCQLALDQPEKAIASLRRALDLVAPQHAATAAEPKAGTDTSRADEARVRNIHYQLALALRKIGAASEAAEHFARAKEASSRRAGAEREQLSRYMTDAPEPDQSVRPVILPLESPFAALTPVQRAAIERQVTTAIARASFNLGVMHVQAGRFARAAEYFEEAAAADPEFSQVQYSLGVAYFNAKQYAKATAPLERALARDSTNAALRRMLALAWFNADGYARAAELLAADAGRESDPSLQYAYGLALVRTDRAAEAEAIFSRLLAQHGDRPEIHVLLGQAHAQQGDYPAAIASLQHALQLQADVAEANATLGMIYLRQGRLADARVALQTELAAHPDDLRAQQTLATVLDLEGSFDQAVALLRALLKAKPDFADARYLLGKILLSMGQAREAAEQLEAAARLAPEDANTHYQLGQAYQRLGRSDLAEQEFGLFRKLKDTHRTRLP